jgi:hypothetical protein
MPSPLHTTKETLLFFSDVVLVFVQLDLHTIQDRDYVILFMDKQSNSIIPNLYQYYISLNTTYILASYQTKISLESTY